MHAADLLVIAALDRLVAQAELMVAEVKSYGLTPAAAVRTAERVAADFHRQRRDMLAEMLRHPVGRC